MADKKTARTTISMSDDIFREASQKAELLNKKFSSYVVELIEKDMDETRRQGIHKEYIVAELHVEPEVRERALALQQGAAIDLNKLLGSLLQAATDYYAEHGQLPLPLRVLPKHKPYDFSDEPEMVRQIVQEELEKRQQNELKD